MRPDAPAACRQGRADIMNIKPLLVAIAGAVVAAFYAVESVLQFLEHGLVFPMLTKLLLCGIGVYVFWNNLKRMKTGNAGKSPVDAA